MSKFTAHLQTWLQTTAPNQQIKSELSFFVYFFRKNQRVLVDIVKAVIKSGKKHKSDEKLRALKLLHKAVMSADQNPSFLVYTEKKILKRLTILAKYCPKDMKVEDCSNLISRGETIFMQDEADKKSAAAFLIVLLECLEKWAERYKRDPKSGD